MGSGEPVTAVASALPIKHVVFPEPAGAYQRAGRIGDLALELGKNYQRYHDYLVGLVSTIGDWPDRRNFKDADAFLDAWDYVQDIAHAEILLRNAVGAISSGASLDRPHDPATPLVDPSGAFRLVRAF